MLVYTLEQTLGMHEESSSCSAVCSASYSTEPSARLILDSHIQQLIRLANSFLMMVGLPPAWFATTRSRHPLACCFVDTWEFQCHKHLLNMLSPSYTFSTAFHQAWPRSKVGPIQNIKLYLKSLTGFNSWFCDDVLCRIV